MPTYDYICEACKHTYELYEQISKEPNKVCPKCGTDKARRIIGAGGGVIFRGDGFYQTTYKTSGKPTPPATPGPGSGEHRIA